MMQRFWSVVPLALLSTIVTAQEFPNRAVRIAEPWPPSGNVDITARTIAPALGTRAPGAATALMPNDADLLDLVESWLPDDAVREPLFAGNAAKLHRFDP